MDIIYKNETKFDEGNNFSIDLTSKKEIQNMMFRERDTWLVSCLGLKIKKFEDSDGYAQAKDKSDLTNKIKKKQKNNIIHGEIQTKLTNFHYLDVNSLVCTNNPNNKTYEYYNTDTKKVDTITFPDYTKWCKENKAV